MVKDGCVVFICELDMLLSEDFVEMYADESRWALEMYAMHILAIYGML